jgi:hypothetical protein
VKRHEDPKIEEKLELAAGFLKSSRQTSREADRK